MVAVGSTKIGVVVSRKKVVASATPSTGPSRSPPRLKRSRQSSLVSFVGRLGRRRSPRVSPTSPGGVSQADEVLRRGLRAKFVRRMATEGVQEVEDMETEMSPERKSSSLMLACAYRRCSCSLPQARISLGVDFVRFIV